MKVVRSVGGVLTGFATMAILMGLATPWLAQRYTVEQFESFSMAYLLANLGCTVVAATLGGYLTALIAGRREIPHAAALGFLTIGLSLYSMRQHGEARPGWYESTLAGCGPMAALVGAAIRMVTKRVKTVA